MVQLSHPYMTTGKTIALTRQTFLLAKWCLCFLIPYVCHSSSSKEQAPFNFMAAISICSDFGAPPNKVWHCFYCFPIYEVMGPDAMIFVFWMSNFKPTFSLSFFTFIKRLFSSLLSAIRGGVICISAVLLFLLAILIPACASSSPAFLIMYSVTMYSLDVLLSQFETSLLFHVQF